MNQTPGDRELDELLDEPGLISLAQGLSRFRPEAVDPDRAFQSDLRRRLLAESWHRNQPRHSLWRRAWTMPNLAWAGAALGIILILGVGIEAVINKPFGVQQLTVTSPVSNAQAVDLRQAIQLNFTRPMDRASVEHAVSIAPAVAVSYTWTSPTSLRVVPVYPLAPDTRYQITVASTANASTGQALGGAAKVGFVTTPLPASPTPPPPPPPTPRPTPTPIKLGSATGLAPLWSQDGKRVYVVGSAGDLESYPAAGGIATQVAPDQVHLVAVGPAGPAFWRAGILHYASTQMAVANVLAIGFAAGQPLVATTADIRTAAGKVLFTLPEAAASAAISSDGTRVAYLNGSGLLRVVDLARATDISLGQADAYAWSPDSHHRAFGAPLGVTAADLGGASPTPTGTPPATPAVTPPATPAATPSASAGASGSVAQSSATATVLTHLAGVKSLSWNVTGEVLASTGEGVFSLKATQVSTPQQILPAAAGAAVRAPTGSDVAYLE
ncbi:MAG: Ig-like domain-containing protein, partial [Candidatus Dormibacteraceae bacterium]